MSFEIGQEKELPEIDFFGEKNSKYWNRNSLFEYFENLEIWFLKWNKLLIYFIFGWAIELFVLCKLALYPLSFAS